MTNEGYEIYSMTGHVNPSSPWDMEGVAIGRRHYPQVPEDEYVTWRYHVKDGEYSFYRGHYFGSEVRAIEDYRDRVRGMGI